MDTSVDNLLFAMQQRNLVYNYNFMYYSNQVIDTLVTYNHPDGWIYNDQGDNGQIGYDPGTASCLIKKSTGDSKMSFVQNISEFPRWQKLLAEQKVSACAIIENPGTSGFEITFSLYDGITTSSKTIFFDGNEKKEISIDININKNPTVLRVSIESITNDAVIYINRVFANIGTIALDTLPCIVEGVIGERKQYMSTNIPPAEEVSLCIASKELSVSYTRLSSFLNGKFGLGENGLSLLPDMRGYFSRAWDNGAKIDPDAASRKALGQGKIVGDHVGTVEEDQFKEHSHQLKFDTNGTVSAGTAAPVSIINKIVVSATENTGGSETRGKNIAELYTMKWA